MRQIITFTLLLAALLLTKDWEQQTSKQEGLKSAVACVPCGGDN